MYLIGCLCVRKKENNLCSPARNASQREAGGSVSKFKAYPLCEIIVFYPISQISYDSCRVAGDDDLIGDIIDYHAASTHNGIGSDGYAAQ